MAVKLTCVNKLRSNNNTIQAYQLRDVSNGAMHELTPDELKRGIRMQIKLEKMLRLDKDIFML